MTQPLKLDRIFEAAIFAARKHEGQVRKDQRHSPYITHPISVARAIWQIGGVEDTNTLIAAILHDTIEDTNTSESDIQAKFGDEILAIVLEVSDDKSLRKIERKREQVAHATELSQQARTIKLADKLINCCDILQSSPEDWTLQRRQDYIQWAADVVAQIRETNSPLEKAFDTMLSEAEEKLGFKIKSFSTIEHRDWAPDTD